MTPRRDFRKVVHSEIDRSIRTHIEFADAEINGVRAVLQSGFQRFAAPGRSKK